MIGKDKFLITIKLIPEAITKDHDYSHLFIDDLTLIKRMKLYSLKQQISN